MSSEAAPQSSCGDAELNRLTVLSAELQVELAELQEALTAAMSHQADLAIRIDRFESAL